MTDHQSAHDKPYRGILAIIGIIMAMGVVGNMDVQEEERQHAEYCEMVKLWKETNGQQGWPAYNGEGACRLLEEQNGR